MLGEIIGGVAPERAHRIPRRRVDDRTRRVAVAIAPVGAGGEQRDAVASRALRTQRVGGGECELLTLSAGLRLAGAEADGRLAAPEHAAERGRCRSSLVRQARLTEADELIDQPLRGERGVIEERLGGDPDWRDAHSLCGCRGSVQRVAVAEDHRAFDGLEERVVRRGRVVRRRLAAQQLAKRARHEGLQSVAFDERENIAALRDSGAHGPEPMDGMSLPTTSDTMRQCTRAGASARARRPAPHRV